MQTFTSETDKKQVLRQDVESFRAAISKSLESYVPTCYSKDKVTFAVYGADNGTITIAISSKNINLSNYWSGSWRGVYSYNVLNGGELKGTVKLHVHYFEDGNVQLHDTVEHSANISLDIPDATAKRVVDSISKFESDFQNQLEEMYVNMNRTTFKAMRRLYPVNRQKFEWNSAAHSLASEVSK
jgi:capping protein alpha